MLLAPMLIVRGSGSGRDADRCTRPLRVRDTDRAAINYVVRKD